MAQQWRGVIREHADRLDGTDATRIGMLGEGGTPLVEATRRSASVDARGRARVGTRETSGVASLLGRS